MVRGATLCFLVLAVAGCKKKAAAVEPDLGPPPPAVDTTLQIAAVSPSSVPPGQPSSVQVIGAGFDPGVTLRVAGTPASSVWLNENVLQAQLPSLLAGTYDVSVTNPDGATSLLRGGLAVRVPSGPTSTIDPACERVTVYFDTNEDGIPAAGRATLQASAWCWTQSTGTVRVEGHADERGTTDYNLALGMRRSDAVKSWLLSAGVAASRVAAASWGEEHPVDAGHDEAAWAKNRRAELVLTPR